MIRAVLLILVLVLGHGFALPGAIGLPTVGGPVVAEREPAGGCCIGVCRCGEICPCFIEEAPKPAAPSEAPPAPRPSGEQQRYLPLRPAPLLAVVPCEEWSGLIARVPADRAPMPPPASARAVLCIWQT